MEREFKNEYQYLLYEFMKYQHSCSFVVDYGDRVYWMQFLHEKIQKLLYKLSQLQYILSRDLDKEFEMVSVLAGKITEMEENL